MELNSITVKRFKKIKKAEIALSELNILVGANGSGKSSALQAIHLSSCLMRQARELRVDRTSPVSINELDYLPSDQYPELGHNAIWGNMTGTPSSEVTFFFDDDEGNAKKAYCEFRSARNAGISVSGAAPGNISNLFRGTGQFFSAYIPGISGIPNQEQKQSKRVVLKACSFGDSNVYLRNVLNLLRQEEIQQLQAWLKELVGPIKINVDHNEERDLTINARVRLKGKDHPIELLGSGHLQLIQIFCYILLFEPKMLLIDEPDIHLHPNVQEKLSSVLARIAKDRGIKILLTTHSPFIVRGAPINTNVFWMENGKINDANRQAVELALGWGAFGKKIIIVSEDKNISLLKKLVSQWPEIEKFVTFHPGRGYANLLSLEQAKELYDALGGKYKLVIHRDRYSLTNDEVTRLTQEYTADGILLWVTELPDIESYFCSPEFISDLTDCTSPEAEKMLEEVLIQNSVPINDQFNSQRQSHNQELYAAGGSPTNNDVWNEFQARPLKGAKGKFVFKQLKNKVPSNQFSEERVLDHTLNVELGGTLKTTLEGLLGN